MLQSHFFVRAAVTLALLLPLSPASLRAQNIKASLSGVVLDPSGAVIPDARVVVRDVERDVERELATNDAGRFASPALEPGRYEVQVRAQGFRPVVRPVKLDLGAAPDLRFELVVAGEVTEVLVVDQAPVTIQTTETKLARTFDAEEMNDLPNQSGFAGRNFYTQALTTPGVNYSPLAHRPFAVSGQRPRNNNYMLDSVQINDPESGFIAGRGVTEQVVSQEAVQGMEVLTHNFKAEYGRSSGSIVNLVSRSGTNDFHGSAYWYHNNSALRARNFFEAEKASGRANLAGFTFGGPIVKNRAFFFSNLETYRVRGEDVSVVRSLTAQQRARAVPAVQPLVDLYPVAPGASTIFSVGVPRRSDQWTNLVRGDVMLTDRQTLHLRHNRTGNVSLLNNISGWVGHRVNTDRVTNSATAQHTWVATPTSTNELRASFMRFLQQDDFLDPITIGNPAVNGEVGFMIVPGLSNAGSIPFMGRQQPLNVYSLSNDYSLIRGAHSIKVGSSARRIQANGGLVNNAFAGTLFFPNIDAFLAAQPLSYTRITGNPLLGLRRTEWDAYVQDDWRVSPKLTLNLGLRYELYTPTTEQYGRIAEQYLFASDRNNFAPRAGLAYRVSDGTVVRAGWGLFYNALEMSFIGLTRFNPPLLTTVSAFRPQLPNLMANASAGIPSGIVVPDENAATPYAQHWNATVERELGRPGSVLSLAYVGTSGSKIPRTLQPNGGENLAQNLRPDATVGVITRLETSASSNYHALQAGLNHHTEALTLKLAYTFSRYIDDVSELATSNTRPDRTIVPLDLRNLRLDRGLSDFHIPHLFAATAIYRLPWAKSNRWLGGWSLTSISTLQSGRPYTLYTGGNNLMGIDNNRIYDLAGTLARNPSADRPVTLANGLATAAAIDPGAGALGTIGRNTERTDRYVNFNAGVVKDVPLSERFKVQFRAEMFNIFNTTSFKTVDNLLGLARDATTGAPVSYNQNFGRYTEAFDPRSAQLTLRLVF